MIPLDYVYRFDPRNPDLKPTPADAESARKSLEDGNRTFARWMASCQSGAPAAGEAPHYLIPCNGREVGLVRKEDGVPKQAPFGVVVGCSDARVPAEMVFGQGFNGLFMVRVAGNVLDDVCQGSVDFAVSALNESVKVVVVLGHSGCGAVAGAVDAYLRPMESWSKSTPALRTILQKIFIPVQQAAGGLDEVWGLGARRAPGYEEALIESAVCLNAAHTAYTLRRGIESAGRGNIEVLFGVYNLFTFQVRMPNDPFAPASDESIRLAPAPGNPSEFRTLALRMAEILKPMARSPLPK